ncbi:MAG TPA: hypothetical protein VK760_03495 [Candidatus Acidoferrales bacterium]|jgi:hypothetical protein|nr:hypothetical protein [Candidatus Acidoferrales bacterium]
MRFFGARFAGASLIAAAVLCAPMAARSADAAPAAVKAIDTDCSAIQSAIQALHPVHLALVSSQWKVMSDADFAVAEQTHTSITFVDAWKAGTGYAWIHAHTFDAKGNQRATQLCFRQADGTLERARQAATMENLNAAAAEQAYYSPGGKLIQKSAAFEENDPALAKKVAALPFFSSLP